mmetsp:Transcript_47194/g.118187  ORF Transcript_47194/g.118187 Transcript_47194/m.118187 type:complete len:203 (+) Transcript_47194:702-1310(+)
MRCRLSMTAPSRSAVGDTRILVMLSAWKISSSSMAPPVMTSSRFSCMPGSAIRCFLVVAMMSEWTSTRRSSIRISLGWSVSAASLSASFCAACFAAAIMMAHRSMVPELPTTQSTPPQASISCAILDSASSARMERWHSQISRGVVVDDLKQSSLRRRWPSGRDLAYSGRPWWPMQNSVEPPPMSMHSTFLSNTGSPCSTPV